MSQDNDDPRIHDLMRKDIKALSGLLNKKGEHLHLVGICGIGMAGLACLLKARGFSVSGCDSVRRPIAEWLRKRGIRVSHGHDPNHISTNIQCVIRSAAVGPDNPEIRSAAARRIPIFSRGTVLAALLTGYHRSVAVCGTHGKTTTSTFIAQLLKHSGKKPSFCIGGETRSLGGVAGAGRSDIIVAEADESDGTLALYKPDVLVVTNIEFDHAEHFKTEQSLEKCFMAAAGSTRHRVIFCADNPGARRVCAKLPQATSYGLSRDAYFRATDIKKAPSYTKFTVWHGSTRLGPLCLPVPGIHNVLNSLAAVATCLEMGLTFDEVRRAFRFLELPERRFDVVARHKGVTVISDYAHHPTEIAALVRTASMQHAHRLIAVFQPHRYSRTAALGKSFPAAFEGVDELVLVPVYAASEQPVPGGTSLDLYAHFRRLASFPCLAASSLDQAWQYLRHRVRKGDILLVVGAGDIEHIAAWAKAELGGHEPADLPTPKQLKKEIGKLSLKNTILRISEPLAPKTTLSVGGTADLWAQIECPEDLCRILRWTTRNEIPFTLIGAGSNVLVSDLGVRGVVARLGKAFRAVREEKNTVVAGAALPLNSLLNFLQERGMMGLEFLEGIPGFVGGAVRMNAGAWGEETGSHVAWIRCIGRDGSESKLDASSLSFGYRSCKGIEGRVLTEVAFAVHGGNTAEIVRKRKRIVLHRAWMKKLRSAGSIFKNPTGRTAGQLIEKAGLKGFMIGGARISREHANVFATSRGAAASDVLALIHKARSEVRRRFGVELETEVVLLE